MKVELTPQDLKVISMNPLKVRPKEKSKAPILKEQDSRENMLLLENCYNDWKALRDFRYRRARNRKYDRGDQWGDYITNPEDPDESITEEQYIINQGRTPLKQNIIRQLRKNLNGQYRSSQAEGIVISRKREAATETEMMSNALQAVHHINKAEELDARLFDEYGLSGAPIQKISWRYFDERDTWDVYLKNVNTNRIFFNSDIEDPRLDDLRRIGEIHDIPIDELVSKFAKNEAHEKRLRETYGQISKEELQANGLSSATLDGLSFLMPSSIDKCRVIEVWYKKYGWRILFHDYLDASYGITELSTYEIDAINQRRLAKAAQNGIPAENVPMIKYEKKYEAFWCVKFLTIYGECLYEGETPYKHQSHPYAIMLWPLIDGEVWGFIEDAIDQQKYINRMVMQLDMMISASAKGLVLIHEDQLPTGYDKDNIGQLISSSGGVLVYGGKIGLPRPEQVFANSVNAGVSEMIAMQLKFTQDILGIHDAIQGKTPQAGTPASRYMQEADNASLNNLDYMKSFMSFKESRDMKIIMMIKQYYDEPRFMAISGKAYSVESKLYDPKKIQDIVFDYKISYNQNTAVFRQMGELFLESLLNNQFIELELYLEQTSLPFADKLLDAIRKRKQQLAQGQTPEAIDPELMNQVQGSANPKAMEMLSKAMGAN